jgi:hypothetical protein
MITATRRAMALATLLLLPLGAPAFGATPAPKPHPIPTPILPKVPLHTEFVVEVNKLGQVVRVKSGKSCKDLTFNAQTYGNVLQMWVRHPDGSAETGLYKVTYDWNPQRKKVLRQVSLVKVGGDWADKRGAANDMMDIADKEAHKAQQKPNLPSLQQIENATPKPTPHA